MFDFISRLRNRIARYRATFRYYGYLLTGTRLSERETIEKLLSIITPTLESTATQFGYAVTVGESNLIMQDSHEVAYGDSRIRQNFNIVSHTTVPLTFQNFLLKYGSVVSGRDLVERAE